MEDANRPLSQIDLMIKGEYTRASTLEYRQVSVFGGVVAGLSFGAFSVSFGKESFGEAHVVWNVCLLSFFTSSSRGVLGKLLDEKRPAIKTNVPESCAERRDLMTLDGVLPAIGIPLMKRMVIPVVKAVCLNQPPSRIVSTTSSVVPVVRERTIPGFPSREPLYRTISSTLNPL
jgi:hypothetical protein